MDAQAGKDHDDENVSASGDMLAGWISGAVGILASNPLEVVKVRLQTERLSSSSHFTPSTSSSSSQTHISSSPSSHIPPHTHSTAKNHPSWHSIPCSTVPKGAEDRKSIRYVSIPQKPSSSIAGVHANIERPAFPQTAGADSEQSVIRQLWRQGGYRVLFAGASGPILGLAFIDSMYFLVYGRCMELCKQNRNNPAQLSRVFMSGAAAGATCAVLQTPIEVVKCRAQAEYQPRANKILGSWDIAKKLIRAEGLSGAYVGGLPTALRDSISSGLFFYTYFWTRKAMRPTNQSQNPAVREEIGRIFAAGGIAGVVSAVFPYPLDIVKTRVQTANVAARAERNGGVQRITMAQAAREIYLDAASTGTTGWSGFTRGLLPTTMASFVGSAVTIGVFEALVAYFNQGARRTDSGTDAE